MDVMDVVEGGGGGATDAPMADAGTVERRERAEASREEARKMIDAEMAVHAVSLANAEIEAKYDAKYGTDAEIEAKYDAECAEIEAKYGTDAEIDAKCDAKCAEIEATCDAELAELAKCNAEMAELEAKQRAGGGEYA